MARTIERLFERFRRRGDAAALGRVFDRAAPELLGVAMHYVRDPVEAEELLQETFLTAIDKAEAFDASRRLVPWLIGILAIHARRALRARGRQPDPLRVMRPVASAVDEDGEVCERVLREIERLSDALRPVLLLRLQHGLEPAEIAHVLGASPGTVRSRLHRGLAELRSRLPNAFQERAGLAAPVLIGLEGVRANVMHAAQAASRTVAAAGAATGAGGSTWLGVLMVTKTQSVLAGGIVLALLLPFILLLDPFGGPQIEEPALGVLRNAPEHAAPSGPRTAPSLVGRSSDGKSAMAPAASVRRPVAESETKSAGEVAGLVTDSTGRPIAGATVRLVLRRGERLEPLDTATSDASGRYVVSLLGLSHYTPLMLRMADMLLWAEADGFAPANRIQVERPSGAAEPLYLGYNISLERRPVLAGRILDENRRPLHGATLYLLAPEGGRARGIARSDASGRYLASLPRTAAARFAAYHPLRGVSQTGRVEIKGPRVHEAQPLIIRATHHIEGVAVDPDGVPLGGLALETRRLPEPRRVPTGVAQQVRWRDGRAVTATDGRFRMPVPCAGAYQIRASDDLARAVRQNCRAGDTDVRVVVPGRRLRVRVRDEAGRPLIGAPVLLRGWSPQRAHRLADLEAGRIPIIDRFASSDMSRLQYLNSPEAAWTVVVPLASAVHLSVNVEGHAPAEHSLRVSDRPGQTNVELVMRRRPAQGRLAVRVVGPDGEPIRAFGVSVLSQTGNVMTHVRSDAEGRLPTVPVGTHAVEILAGQARDWLDERFQLTNYYVPERRRVTIPPVGEAAISVRVHLGGRIRLDLRGPATMNKKRLSLLRASLHHVRREEPIHLSMFVAEDEKQGLELHSRYYPGLATLVARLIEPDTYELRVVGKGITAAPRTVEIKAGTTTAVQVDVLDAIKK